MIGRGAPFFLGHLAVCLVVQVESYAIVDRTLGLGGNSAWIFAASLPFLQLQHVWVSSIPGLLGGLRWRPAAHSALLLLNLWVVLDQVVFRVFLRHADLAMDESSVLDGAAMLGSLRDSVVAVGGGLTALNLLFVCVVSCAVAWCDARAPFRSWVPGRTLRWAALGWMVVSAPVACSLDHHGLEQHAAVALVGSLWRDAPPPAEVALSKQEILAPAFDASVEPVEVDRALRSALGRLRALERPNVLLVVMESVGSLQLFPDDHVEPDVTPNLARLVGEGVAFTDLYTTFPATVRALIGLHAGGRTITWGSVHFELGFPYRGPTLVSHFREKGYRTALYSAGDMDFENLNDYLAGLGFDAVVDAGRQSEAWRARHAIHSWGVADDAMRADALRWMLQRDAAGEPFLLEYITVSTHHPYGVPEGIAPRFPGADALSRYRSALHYSDGFLGRLLEELRLAGVLEKTLVVVTGDHGQAFGRRHPGNLLHKNHLYEENVRTFAIVAAPGSGVAPVVSRRVGTLGDILPTLVRVFGDDLGDVWGQSLWPDDYAPRIAYFHKSAPPEAWGLRDGRYKFVAERADGAAARLYDLRSDPGEQRDIAAGAPEQVARYRELCAQWYAAVNASFVAQLEGYTIPGGPLQPSEVATPGPKRLAVGVRGADGKGREGVAIGPEDQVVAWAFWVPEPDAREVEFVWTSPQGVEYAQSLTLSALATNTRIPFTGPRPLERGTWRVAVVDRERETLETRFEVGSR